ncbi:MAG: SPFH domain-containing protein [Bacteroidales bacterium]|jgi:regulator of protease activity HflC (stomatin/prohibitin superfamily)|nr:SPFH domain-containing protein [Bacteroidales bacterium]
MKKEKEYRGSNGYVAFILLIFLLAAIIAGGILFKLIPLFVLIPFILFAFAGLVAINPNESVVLVLFGKYNGTMKDNGFFWVNPLYSKKRISLRARNFDSEPIKVNDKIGNPIMIGIVLVWKVENTFKAAFEVDEYEHFVRVQSEAALRKLAGHYPYDNFEDEEADITLRAGGEMINSKLEEELRERLDIAGIHVIEARINYIAYAAEIASAMLKRQQATAIVAAREKIVEGSVGMVQMALKNLKERDIIDMDEEKKAAMISNLMVVLCSDESARPIVNTGTLHH